MDKVSLLLPTRGRPMNMDRFWRSAYETAAEKKLLEVVFYVDNDDEASQEKLNDLHNEFNTKDNFEITRIKAVMGRRIVMSEMTNKAYTLATGNILGLMGDDIIFRTRGWDNKVREAFDKYDDKIALVYGDDGYANNVTHPFIHRNWATVLGNPVPNGFVGDYVDTYLAEISELIGRKVHIDILTEHMHWCVKQADGSGKGPMDKTMQEKNWRSYSQGKPVNVLFEETRPQRIIEAKKLRHFIEQHWAD